MASEPSTSGVTATLDELRQAYVQSQIDRSKFLVRIEESKDKIYSIDPLGMRFRRWTHEEANMLHRLPFIAKVVAKEPLTNEEEAQYQAFKVQLVKFAVVDKGRWEQWLNDPANGKDIENIFWMIADRSGQTKAFAAALTTFMESDYGHVYGLFWFKTMGMTPSQIAQLPDTDVSAINVWLLKWSERMGRES